jgi:hypothetical protein
MDTFRVEVLLKPYVTQQLETFHVTGKVEKGVRCQVLEEWRLPSAYLTGASFIRCKAAGEGVDIESKRVSTADASRWNIQPHTCSLVIP